MTRESRPPDGCGSDGAAYVLAALEPDEVETYRRHLSLCAACRDEVAALQRVADVLPMAAAQYRLPARLRRRVVRTVRAEARRGRRGRRRPALAALLPRLPQAGRALVGAAAVALTAIVIAAAILVSAGPAGPKVLQATVINSTGSAQLRIGGGRAELLVRHLRAPAPGRIYEVWLKRQGAAPAPTTALFNVPVGGAAEIGIPGALGGVSEVLVTEEPAGGSRVPTGPPVIVAPTS
jgi:Anti-sigma-K factor rskA